MRKKEVSGNGKNAKEKANPNYLKWTWIVLVILSVLLIGAFDYCSRTGNL